MRTKLLQATAIHVLILVVFLTSSTAYVQAAKEAKGAVCAGFNGSFFLEDLAKGRLYFTVGDSEKFFFDPPGKIVLNNLDPHKTYVMRVFNRGEQIHSWNLRFDKLKVRMVTVWRSTGYWHMDPSRKGECK